MKKSLLVLAIALFSFSAFAQVHVKGYTRSDGTYVAPHERSAPNGTVTDNYSFKGNSNPYNGSVGTNEYRHDTTSPYFNGTPDNQGNYGHDNNNGYGR